MVRLNIIVEGHSEETFVRDTISPFLAESEVYVSVRRVETGRDKHNKHIIYRGGLLNYQKLHDDILRWINEDHGAWFSTMIDLYALPNNFPEFDRHQTVCDPYEKVAKLEESFANDIGFRHFIPYIQLHEFEALLLCDPSKLEEYFIEATDAIADLHTSCCNIPPELINNGVDTAPSKRIIRYIPAYEKAKAAAGPITAAKIGLPMMQARCPHFAQWLQSLAALASEASS